MNSYLFDQVVFNRGLSYFNGNGYLKLCEDLEVFLSLFLYMKPSYIMSKISFDRSELLEVLNMPSNGKIHNLPNEQETIRFIESIEHNDQPQGSFDENQIVKDTF